MELGPDVLHMPRCTSRCQVNFHLFDASTLKKPVQGHFGELDAMVGFSDAATGRKLEAELKAGGNGNVEVFIYPKVGHAFMNDSPSPFPTFAARMEKMGDGFPPYDAATADLAWSRLLTFFSQHLWDFNCQWFRNSKSSSWSTSGELTFQRLEFQCAKSKITRPPALYNTFWCQNSVIFLASFREDDREVVLAATSARGSSLVHASQRLRQERAVVLSAVSQDGSALAYGCDEFRRKKCEKSVKNWDQMRLYHLNSLRILHFFRQLITSISFSNIFLVDSIATRKDKEFIMLAAALNGLCLQYASVELRADRQVVLQAIRSNPYAFLGVFR